MIPGCRRRQPPIGAGFVSRSLLTVFHCHLIAELRRLSGTRDALPDLSPDDAALFLAALIQGSIRWTLGSRGFSLRAEGVRLPDIQLKMLAPGRNAA